MADTIYLNYGNQQVDLLALLTTLANNVQNYVQKQTWSKKRKEKFLNAYTDLMNRGIKGASNNTGQWLLDIGGSPIVYGDKKDEEMYGEAAYFILLQMSNLASTPKTDEQTEESEESLELPKFTSTKQEIEHRIGKNLFGGEDYTSTNFRDLYEEPRGENGLFGTSGRRKVLAELLRLYKDELNTNPVDFTESAFKDLNDYQNQLDKVIQDLENSEISDQELKKSLFSIGLDYNDWFNNGSGDIYIDENGYSHINKITNKPFTYAEWNNYLNQLQTLKEEEATAAAEAKQKKLDALEIYTSKPHQKLYSFTDLSNKYGDTNSFLQNFKGKQILNLNQEESDELTSFFYTLISSDDGKLYLQDLSDEEWEPLKSKLLPVQSKYGYGTIERSKNLFKKILGLDGIYYDTVQNNLIQIGEKGLEPLKDLFSGLSDKEKEEAYLNSEIPGLTNAEWLELVAIGADIVSILDPEPFSAGGFGVAAADLRRRALNLTPGHKWGFWDIVGQGVDYVTGALAAIPGFGDATLAAKLATKISPTLRIVGRLGAWKDLYDSIPGLKAVYDKAMNGEELTLGDWRLIGQGIRGLVTHGRMSKANLAERKIILESGYTPEKISGMRGKILEYGQKTGFFRTSVPRLTTTPTVKVEVNGKAEEIPITENQKAIIETEVKKAKNDVTKRNTAVEKVLKEYKQVKESDKITVEAPNWKDSKFSPVRGTSDKLFGTLTAQSISRGNDNFENWLNTRSNWSRIAYGTDNSLRRMRRWMGITDGVNLASSTPSSAEVSSNTSTTQNGNNNSVIDYFPEGINDKELKELQNAFNPPQRKLTRAIKVPLSNKPIEGKLVDGTSYNVSYDGKDMIVTVSGKAPFRIKGDLHDLKRRLGDWINTLNSLLPKIKRDSSEWKNFVTSIKELKRKGYLFRKGGKITNSQIDNFLKQYK